MKSRQQWRVKFWLLAGLLTLAVPALLGGASATPAVLAERREQSQELRVDPVQALREQQHYERRNRLIQEVQGSQVADDDVVASAAVSAEPSYIRVTDATETLSLDIPSEWRDVDLGAWNYEGAEAGFFVAASTDLAAFEQELSAPGIFFGSSTHLVQEYTETEMLALEEQRLLAKFPSCQRQAEVEYADQMVVGHYYIYRSCTASTEQLYFTLVASPPTQGYLVVLRVNLPASSFDTLSHIFDTFQVIGLPGQDDHHADEGVDAHTHP